MNGAYLDHADRDEIKRRAEVDFGRIFDDHGGRRRGKALFCLFHQNKRTAAASIHKGRFHCFGCGADLDVFEFVQRIQNTDFKGALTYLADRYGVQLQSCQLTEAEKREYAQRRTTAEREATRVAEWRDSLIEAVRKTRNVYMSAAHRAQRHILRCGKWSECCQVAAEVAEVYEPRWVDLEAHIDALVKASPAELVEAYRSVAA
jgi:hypothetical protein